VLPACATPTGESATAFPAEYKADILALARQYVDGPYKVKDAAISDPVLKPFNGGQRYIVCVKLNPAGADGKFLGMKGGVGIFWFGKLDQVAEIPMGREEAKSNPLPESPAGLCRDAAYKPFPEAEKL
jgi:hypothetical protein